MLHDSRIVRKPRISIGTPGSALTAFSWPGLTGLWLETVGFCARGLQYGLYACGSGFDLSVNHKHETKVIVANTTQILHKTSHLLLVELESGAEVVSPKHATTDVA